MPSNMSNRFFDAFTNGIGSCVGECACGKTHFDSENDWSWEDGELETLKALAKKKPSKYQEHDCSIGFVSLMGNEIVSGCTCDSVRKYEDFLLKETCAIATYIRALHAEKERELEAIKL